MVGKADGGDVLQPLSGAAALLVADNPQVLIVLFNRDCGWEGGWWLEGGGGGGVEALGGVVALLVTDNPQVLVVLFNRDQGGQGLEGR